MPTISKISVQKKNKQRYSIFLKDQQSEYYAFSIDEDLLISYHLHKGQEISQELIDQIQEKDASYKVYTLSIKFLSYRMRSEQELINYLQKKDIEITFIKEAVHRLKQENLLDDHAFSEALVRTRVETSEKGPLMVKKELIEKGIDQSVAEQALEHFPYTKQYEKIAKLIKKKMNRTSKKSYKQQIDNMKQSLIQKGYSLGVISEVLQQMDTEINKDEEYEAIVYQGEKALEKYKKKDTGFQLQQKVKASLFRKGFDSELIQRFIEEYAEREN
ncbi:recombination regulator RecX [Gracilibacillus oryzae]|uniref:Regulatory protein RecX n=1 Tax=Gracilibacillus oryzae TaxID=1672701 RepID=A0A7C8L5W9_9BACI|nr:recombination regulator RecX [Gracilibacillus oryzae]KAB8129380.1 recombination regulator RecX [Gracilibacillus oryzae]